MSIIKLDVKNPLDIVATYATIVLERSPDDSTWAQIATFAIDATREATAYTDASGSTTSFYRAKFRPTVGSDSDYAPSFQVGELLPIEWIMADITDTAVDASDWTRWLEQAMVDLYGLGIWYEGVQAITPTLDPTYGNVLEYYGLNAMLREVFRVELVDATTAQHRVWLDAEEWEQENRRLRLFDPDNGFKYVAHGKSQYKRAGELTDDMYTFILWKLRLAYTDLQLDKRKDFRRYIVSDPSRDISIEQLRTLRDIAAREVAARVEPFREREPGYAAG